MAKFKKTEVRVGLFLIVPVILLLIFIALKMGYSLAGSTIDLYLKIDSINSVKKGTPIMLKGYTIGRVVEIKPYFKPGLHFLAKMRINSEIELNEDCSAIIQNKNIIGDPVIEFRNPEKSTNLIHDNDVIEGVEYANLDSVLQDVHVLLTTLSDTVAVVKQISMDSKGNLRNMVTSLAGSMSSLNKILANSEKDIKTILGSFRKTALTLDEISKELKKHPVKFLFK